MMRHLFPVFTANLLDRPRILMALALLACVFTGCEGHTIVNPNSNGPVAGWDLAAPAQMLSRLDARGASSAGQTKPGALYESTLPSNKVAINGTALDFTPAWDLAGSHQFSDLAYAIYLFDGTGLTGASAVTSIWTAAPAAVNLWIGLADFSTNRWAWFQPGVSATLAIADLAPFIDPADSRILVAYALTGTAACTLSSVTLGEYVPEIPLPVVPLTPVPGVLVLAGPILVDGNPALAYLEDMGATSRLIFMRALDSDGAAWGTPVEIAADVVGTPGLAVIGGRPATAFESGFLGPLMYCRADDAQGSSWGTPLTVDSVSAGAGAFTELLEIEGRPAIAYLADAVFSPDAQILYIRADDATGGSWPAAPVLLNPEYPTGEMARELSFAIVGGNPAVAYNWVNWQDITQNGLRYVRAGDATGTAWGAPVDITGSGYDSACNLRNVDMVDLGGLPGIMYYIEDYDTPASNGVYFCDAQNVVGATWDAPQVVLASPPGEDPVNFGALQVLTRLDGTQRAIVVVTRDGTAVNDCADIFDATVPPAGGADFSTGVKHMIARFQLSKGSSVTRSVSCYDSVDAIGLLFNSALLGGDEYVQLAAAMLGSNLAPSQIGVSTTHATLPAGDF